VDQYGDRDVLVATKDDRVVVLVPGASLPPPEATEATLELGRFVDAQLHRGDGPRRWKVGAGRAFPGAFGVARSYEEAREILELAERLDLETLALSPGQLLLYRVLIRDQAAIIDLVHTVVGPLGQARGGAGPLLETLWTFFDSSDVATETARRMHLSVRAVTYRLAKVRELTGYNPLHPEQRFALHAAVLGARLLGWPTQPLPGLT
jgi:sugar diacid utilization regulator